MIEELQILIDAVAKVPTLAVWVAGGFMVYKLAVTGSIVAAVVLCWRLLMETVQTLTTKPKKVDIGGIVLDYAEGELLAQLSRLKGKRGGTLYIHQSGVDWLREAIDEKEARDREQEK